MRNFNGLIEKSWLEKLNPFLQSNRFDRLSKLMIDEQKFITPAIQDVFRCFKECSYDNLKVVIVGLDPYPGILKGGIRVADGLAFSSRDSVNQPPKSLEYIYRAIEEDLSIVMDRRNNDLTYLANQGILFFNSALTTRIGKTGAHTTNWEPFTEYVINMLNKTYTGLVYLFLGKVAQQYNQLVTTNLNYVFNIEHPAATAYKGKDAEWNHKSVFKDIVDVLDMNSNTKLHFNEI